MMWENLISNDLLLLIGIGALCAACSAGLKRFTGWEYEMDDLERSTRLPNSDGWSLYDCSSSHLDHNRRD